MSYVIKHARYRSAALSRDDFINQVSSSASVAFPVRGGGDGGNVFRVTDKLRFRIILACQL